MKILANNLTKVGNNVVSKIGSATANRVAVFNDTNGNIKDSGYAICMLGKLLVYDDGTCEVGGYCKPNKDGIATKSESGYRVMLKKID